MLTDLEGRVAFSNLGWVDRGSLWMYESARGERDPLRVADAASLRLRRVGSDAFVCMAHSDERVELSVRAFAAPDVRIATASAGAEDESAADKEFPPFVTVAWFGRRGYCLVRVDSGRVSLTPLGWFNDDPSWDHGYQSVIDAVELPATGNLLFGLQRSSALILTDASGAGVLARIDLPGFYGNLTPTLLPGRGEVWVINSDTLVRLDATSVAVTGHVVLGESMWVSGRWFSSDEARVAVARPGSGDVVILDTDSLEIVRHVITGSEPLTAAVLHDGTVVARDWKTGDLLEARA
jgi:hypothetical protein